MTNKFLSAPLESICEEIIDCPHSTPKWTDSGVVVIRSQNIKGGRLSFSSISYTDEETYKKRSKRIELAPNDLIITREAPMGEVCKIPEGLRCCLGQRMVALRANTKLVLPEFLLYALQGPHVQHQISFSEGTGSTVSNMRIPVLEALEIPLPSAIEQSAISKVLTALDNKIELNQKMNQTLEEMAKTIFKSWFVDFDPVRAKAEGRPTGLPPEISDLFPDELVDSEIGEIPREWEVKTISDLAECVGGATPPTKNPDFWEGGDITWTSPKDLSAAKSIHLLETNKKITEAGLKKISSGLLPVGTVLLSSRAPVGYLALTTEPTAINQGYIALKPMSGISNYFLLHWCASKMDEIKNRASGTTFAEISKAAFRPIPAIAPCNNVMEKFHEFASPIYERALVASKETETLTELRDTLLPKLISGELRIPDAEKFLEEVGI